MFPAFSRIAGDRDRFAAAYLRALHWSMVGAAAGTGLMIAAGEPAVVVLFGEQWRGAGVALVAMSGLSIGSAMQVVVMDVIKAHGRTRLINWCTLADLFLGVGFLLVLIRPFGFAGASLYISLTSLTTAAVMLGLAQTGGDRSAPQGPDSSGDADAEPARRNRGRVVAGTPRTARRFSRADSRGRPAGRRCPGVLPGLPGGADRIRATDSGHDRAEGTRLDRPLPPREPGSVPCCPRQRDERGWPSREWDAVCRFAEADREGG